MGAESSHHIQSNGNANVTQDYTTPSPRSSSPRRKKSKKNNELPEFNNNVTSNDYVYSLINKRQWDAVLELTIEKSLSSDVISQAISPLTVLIYLETESRFHFKVLNIKPSRLECA